MNRASSATGWVRNPDGTLGWTWNPITGCLNGCEYCYARKLANTRLRDRYLANTNVAPLPLSINYLALEKKLGCKEDELCNHAPFYLRFWDNRLLDARDELCNTKPRGIFVCDMSDLFGIGVPKEWTQRVMDVIKSRSQHRFYLLTKQPQNLSQWSPFPDNCWVGVTATDNLMAAKAIIQLNNIQAKVKYISFEPLLERIDSITYEGLDWVIIGAQTKPYKPPEIEWVAEIVLACDKAGIPVFQKDNLKPLLDTLDITDTSFGRLTSLDISINRQGCRRREWYQLRQEMPG